MKETYPLDDPHGIVDALEREVALYREALLAERAYHSNNTGENAAWRKRAIEALPKGWNKRPK